MSKLEFYYDHEIGEWMMSEVKAYENHRGSSIELKVCAHDFVLYEGFTDRFYYCKRCDMKKQDDI